MESRHSASVSSPGAHEETGALSIAIGADAAGLPLKQHLVQYLTTQGYHINDVGTYTEEPVDYPDYASMVCEAIAEGESQCGLAICGTGIGMSIAANKIAGIRAALCTDTFGARKSREHNDANVLALGAWEVTQQRAEEIVDVWLRSGYEGGRHAPRLAKLRALDTARRRGEGAVQPDEDGVATLPGRHET